MMITPRFVPIVFVVLALVTAGMSAVRENARWQAGRMAEAAQAFLDTLTADQVKAASFPFDSDDRSGRARRRRCPT